MNVSDHELIVRVVRQDDRAAFGELVVRHQSTVRRFLRHLVQTDWALADDLAQETFLRAYAALPTFGNRAAFSTWLLGIAHNLWRNAARRRRTSTEPEASTVPRESAFSGPGLRSDVADALRSLSAGEQLAIHLTYQQGLSHADIATVLGWPLGTVKTHLARAKAKLREQLAAWNPQT